MAKPSITDIRKEIEKLGNFRSHVKYYKMTPKYHRLVPAEVNFCDNIFSLQLRMMKI
jgi:hypothetical protein